MEPPFGHSFFSVCFMTWRDSGGSLVTAAKNGRFLCPSSFRLKILCGVDQQNASKGPRAWEYFDVSRKCLALYVEEKGWCKTPYSKYLQGGNFLFLSSIHLTRLTVNSIYIDTWSYLFIVGARPNYDFRIEFARRLTPIAVMFSKFFSFLF